MQENNKDDYPAFYYDGTIRPLTVLYKH